MRQARNLWSGVWRGRDAAGQPRRNAMQGFWNSEILEPGQALPRQVEELLSNKHPLQPPDSSYLGGPGPGLSFRGRVTLSIAGLLSSCAASMAGTERTVTDSVRAP